VSLAALLLSACPQLADDEFSKVSEVGAEATSDGTGGAETSGSSGTTRIDLSTSAGGTAAETTSASTTGSNTGAGASGGTATGTGGETASTLGTGGLSSTASGGAGGETSSSGGSSSGGETSSGGVGGSTAPGSGGTGGVTCAAERCDGLDNDCNDEVDDDDVCEDGCVGFAIAGRGYMYCAARLTWEDAAERCEQDDMHLAWVDSESENDELFSNAAAAYAVGEDGPLQARAWLGARDATEGQWRWVPDGELFWEGEQDGELVGSYANWSGAPRPVRRPGCSMPTRSPRPRRPASNSSSFPLPTSRS
jgi:hypothetical protein